MIRRLAHNDYMKTTTNEKTAAGSGYLVTNGEEIYGPISDRSNANRKAKKLNAKLGVGGNLSGQPYVVKPAGIVAAAVPTIPKLQAAVDTASAAIKGKAKAKKAGATQKAATDLGIIAKEGKKLALKRKSSGAIYAKRANKPGAIEKLLYQAKMVGLKVENAKEAAALVAAKPGAKA